MGKKILKLFTIIIIITMLVSCADGMLAIDKDVLYQVSSLQLLIDGEYDGIIKYGSFDIKGDFGIGTFHALDGEMVMLDDKTYRIDMQGKAHKVDNDELCPFASVTYFDYDDWFELASVSSYDELMEKIDHELDDKNIFYAIKIVGTFDYLKLRSVPKQEKPYKNLYTVLEDQGIFIHENVEGTMVGFWCPEYIGGVNASGYHFHFISSNKSFGGHVLELSGKNITGEIDTTTELEMILE
jgi:acetolactate decarboxylase